MKPAFLLFIALFIKSVTTSAQDFQFGEFHQEEMSMSSYSKDPSAHAVVLNEHGDARIANINGDEIRLIYKYHVKIKIFDKEAFDKGTIEIPLYVGKELREEIDEIQGVTFTSDANGAITKTELQKNQIFNVDVNKTHRAVRFAMPRMQSNCIIEFKYTVITPYFEDLHDWQFQTDIPKVQSLYEIHVPGYWQFNALKRGTLELGKTGSHIEEDCFSVRGSKASCAHLTYSMANIPAFIEEDYMTAPRNFISAIYFELAEYTNPYNGVKTKLANEWKDVDNQLKRDQYFGAQIKKRDQFKDKIAPVIAGKADALAKAKAVYAFIQKNMKWNEFISFNSENVRKAFESHTGTSGDINLALVAALASAGIDVEAVLISTRSHGVVNKLYPVITEFNYVLAKANIDDKSYLLDATDPLLSFGMLPMRCLNDQGRVMSLDKPSYWVDIKTPNVQSTIHVYDLSLTDDGKLAGTITYSSRGYSAYQKRQAIGKFNSVDEYVENLDEKLKRIKIKKFEIKGVDSLDQTVSEVYTVEVDLYEGTNHEKMSFNPYVFERITTNPFKLSERSYPVDWGVPSEERIILNVKFPEAYVIESAPETVSIGLPNKGGQFAISYSGAVNSFSLSHIMQFQKSIYTPEEYPYLKELYNKIILSQKSEIVFKKKI